MQLILCTVLTEHLAIAVVWLIVPLTIISKNLDFVLLDVLVVVDRM